MALDSLARGLASLATPKYLPGRVYAPHGMEEISAGSAGAANTIRMCPGFIRKAVSIERLYCMIGTAAAGGLFSLAIYASDPVSGLPTGAPVYSSASTTTGAANMLAFSGLSLVLQPGIYWFAVNVDTTGAATVFRSLYTGSVFGVAWAGCEFGNWVLDSGGNPMGYTKAQAFGTWPTLTGNFTTDALANLSASSCPAVAFRVAP